MEVAFKLGTVLGVFLLPLLTYASFRLMGFRSPGPLLGAAGALVFLFVEENPIWGGTIASTLTGEFSYTYGIGFAVLFLGVTYRAISRGHGYAWPALALALTALAHGYAVLWAGLAASFFLYGARRPERTLRLLLGIACLAFALAAFFLVPLLADWGWTTPYDDAWITISLANLLPVLLAPLFVAAVIGTAWTLVWGRRAGGADRRVLFLAYAALAGAALTVGGTFAGHHRRAVHAVLPADAGALRRRLDRGLGAEAGDAPPGGAGPGAAGHPARRRPFARRALLGRMELLRPARPRSCGPCSAR